jgi:hypothetical protein
MWTVKADNNEATTLSSSIFPNQDILVSKFRDQIEFATDRCYFWYGKGGGEGVFYILYNAFMDENGVKLVFEKETRYIQWKDITKIWTITWKSMNTGMRFYFQDGKNLGIVELNSKKIPVSVMDIYWNWRKVRKAMKKRGEL